jgi:hypothetical protein
MEPYVRVGSNPDSHDLPPPRPELGDKQTSILGGWTSESSHKPASTALGL